MNTHPRKAHRRGLVDGLLSDVSDAIQPVDDTVGAVVKVAAKAVRPSTAHASTFATPLAPSQATKSTRVVKNTVGGLLGGIEDAVEGVADAVQTIVSKVVHVIEDEVPKISITIGAPQLPKPTTKTGRPGFSISIGLPGHGTGQTTSPGGGILNPITSLVGELPSITIGYPIAQPRPTTRRTGAADAPAPTTSGDGVTRSVARSSSLRTIRVPHTRPPISEATGQPTETHVPPHLSFRSTRRTRRSSAAPSSSSTVINDGPALEPTGDAGARAPPASFLTAQPHSSSYADELGASTHLTRLALPTALAAGVSLEVSRFPNPDAAALASSLGLSSLPDGISINTGTATQVQTASDGREFTVGPAPTGGGTAGGTDMHGGFNSAKYIGAIIAALFVVGLAGWFFVTKRRHQRERARGVRTSASTAVRLSLPSEPQQAMLVDISDQPATQFHVNPFLSREDPVRLQGTSSADSRESFLDMGQEDLFFDPRQAAIPVLYNNRVSAVSAASHGSSDPFRRVANTSHDNPFTFDPFMPPTAVSWPDVSFGEAVATPPRTPPPEVDEDTSYHSARSAVSSLRSSIRSTYTISSDSTYSVATNVPAVIVTEHLDPFISEAERRIRH